MGGARPLGVAITLRNFERSDHHLPGEVDFERSDTGNIGQAIPRFILDISKGRSTVKQRQNRVED